MPFTHYAHDRNILFIHYADDRRSIIFIHYADDIVNAIHSTLCKRQQYYIHTSSRRHLIILSFLLQTATASCSYITEITAICHKYITQPPFGLFLRMHMAAALCVSVHSMFILGCSLKAVPNIANVIKFLKYYMSLQLAQNANVFGEFYLPMYMETIIIEWS